MSLSVSLFLCFSVSLSLCLSVSLSLSLSLSLCLSVSVSRRDLSDAVTYVGEATAADVAAGTAAVKAAKEAEMANPIAEGAADT